LIRALLDQGLPRSSTALLRKVGWDVTHAADVGLATATDAAILERAASEGRIVVTLDADFHRLLAISGASQPSVVRIREEGLKAESMAALLVDAVTRAAQPLATGAAVTVTARRIRIRALPIRKSP
jgi:predicted nuclease of predicted toxin-antitoxin system